MALDIITWLWGDKYGPADVIRLESRIRQNLKTPFQFHVCTDHRDRKFSPSIHVHAIPDHELMNRSCFCRLRMFDPEWQRQEGMSGTMVAIDLDVVIVGALDPLFQTEDSFKILTGANAVNPNPYNASIMLLQAGQHPEVWRDFSPTKAKQVDHPDHEFPDDQGWLWHMLPGFKGWPVGQESGIYAFQKPGWPKGNTLPADARMVVFFGYRKPAMFAGLPWIKKYWTEAA